jgi:hypothetical protein
MTKSPDFKVLDVDPNNIPPVDKSAHIRQEQIIDKFDEVDLRLEAIQAKLAVLENMQSKPI